MIPLPQLIWFRKQAAGNGDRSFRLFVLILLAVVALLISRATAAVHPVPLDPKTDASKCLECHEDKSKGKAVHSAIAMGCLSCHEIRVNKDVTRVKLITTTPYGLCLTCHADKDASQIKGYGSSSRSARLPEVPRSAYVGQQESVAESASQATRKIISASRAITTGVNVPEKGSRHAALDMGCDTCHVTHKTGAEPTLKTAFT